MNSWRKWLELKSGEGEPLPEGAVTIFRVVQANWAVPEKIAGGWSRSLILGAFWVERLPCMGADWDIRRFTTV